MCGIFGHAGISPEKVNIDKINILGIWNEERGTDSCGIAIDGTILKGVNALKVYRDFISYYDINQPSVLGTVIGHTRKSTVGAHTLSNAHPFGFGKLKHSKIKGGTKEFIGVHNGTLLNHTDLATSRGISLTKKATVVEKDRVTKKETVTEMTVSKIDSELLLECIYHDKGFKVLSEYNGAAALIFQDLNYPNKVFFYHGKSAATNAPGAELEEERPLYYYQADKNSLYVSSIIDSLYAIGGDNENVGMFDHNVVYEVTNGNLETAVKHEVNREGKYKRKTYYGNYSTPDSCGVNSRTTPRNFRRPLPSNTPPSNSKIGKSSTFSSRKYYPKLGTAAQLELNLSIPVDSGLLHEEFDMEQNEASGLTLFKQTRYWRNGHLASGVFAHIEGYGFYLLGNSKEAALKSLAYWSGKPFAKGNFYTKHTLEELSNDAFIPFKKDITSEEAENYLHYMYNGIRYRDELDYKAIVADDMNNKKFSIVELSMCSAHPLIDLDNKIKGVYFKGELCNETVAPLGCNKRYSFKFGQLKEISYIPGFVPEALIESTTPIFNLSAAEAFLVNSAKGTETDPVKKKKSAEEVASLSHIVDDLTKIEKSRLNKIILNNFNENYEEFPKALRILKELKEKSTVADTAYYALKSFLISCNEIVKLQEIEESKNK